MARVSSDLVVVEDTLYVGEQVEEAEQLRDPTHVRSYTEDEWRAFLEAAGLEVEQVESFEKRHPLEEWLGAAGTPEDDAARVRELLADQIEGDEYVDTKLALQGAEGVALVAIIVDRETKLVVQGLTGSEGSFHGLRNKRYGTQVVAGVTPGKGGQDVEGVPVFDTVADAVAETGANTTMVFVPAPLRRRRDLRGGRRRHRHRRSASPRACRRTRCCAIYAYIRPKGVTMLGPELPRRALARARRTSGSSRPRSSARARSASSRARAR